VSCAPDVPTFIEVVQATSDVLTVPVADERLREIVSDESEDVEKRRLAYELASTRTALRLHVEIDKREKGK
jgi:hypothetical protein